jgi:hypothetical protein
LHWPAQYHPQQLVTVLRAGRDVRREIAGIEIGDRSNESRPGKGPQARQRRAWRQRAADEMPSAVEDEIRA